MSKIGVVYWSGTGNTEAMANAVSEGIKGKGGEATMLTPDDFKLEMLDSMDAVAFGCPAMGDEVLEETEYEPMFDSCKAKLDGKKIALFGSYGWGDGEWMRSWEESCKEAKAVLVCESVICNEEPDDEAIEACKALGAALV
ncbi:MAG: flavodoxin [Clostridia bacterium]|nr:flavodoxin [Clostridia bacterium]